MTHFFNNFLTKYIFIMIYLLYVTVTIISIDQIYVFAWLPNPLPPNFDHRVAAKGEWNIHTQGPRNKTKLDETPYWFIPLKKDPETHFPTSPYWLATGSDDAEFYPSTCGNGPTLNNHPLQLIVYHIFGNDEMCRLVKNPGDIALTGSEELSAKYLARYKQYNISLTELSDPTKWRCGLSEKCLKDVTCCPRLKEWFSVALFQNLGQPSRYFTSGGVSNAAGMTEAKLFRFKTVNPTSTDGPFGPGTAMTNFFDPMAGWNNQSSLDMDSDPWLPTVGAFGPGQACTWTTGCAGGSSLVQQSIDMIADPTKDMFGPLKWVFAGLPMAIDYKRKMNDAPPNPYSIQGKEMSDLVYEPLIKEVYYRYNRCLDPSIKKRLSVSYANKVGLWPNRIEPGPDHPACTDGFIYRGRNHTTELEWSKGNNTGNIFNKEELFVLFTPVLWDNWVSVYTYHADVALQIVNDPNQEAFPNLKNFFIGLVLGENMGRGKESAQMAAMKNLYRLPQGTIAATGNFYDDQCGTTVPVQQLANLITFAGGCTANEYRNQDKYPLLVGVFPSTMSSAKLLNVFFKKVGWLKIHVLTDLIGQHGEYTASMYYDFKGLVAADKAANVPHVTIVTDYNYVPDDFVPDAATGRRYGYVDLASHARIIREVLKPVDARIIVGFFQTPIEMICSMIREGFMGKQYVVNMSLITKASIGIININYAAAIGSMPCNKAEFDYWLPKMYINFRPHLWPSNSDYFYGPNSKDPADAHLLTPHSFNKPSENPSTIGSYGSLREIAEKLEASFDFQKYDIDFMAGVVLGGIGGYPIEMPTGFDAFMLLLKSLDTVIGKYNYTSASEFPNDPHTGVLLDEYLPHRLRQAALDPALGDWTGVSGKIRMNPTNGGRDLGVGIYQFSEFQPSKNFLDYTPPISLVYTADLDIILKADLELTQTGVPSIKGVPGTSVLKFVDPLLQFDLSLPDGHATSWNIGGQDVGQGNATVPRDATPICPVGRMNIQVPMSHIETCEECDDGYGPHPRDLIPTERSVCHPCSEGYYSNKNTTMKTADELGTLAIVSAHTCTKCPVGTITNTTGQTECVECLPGTYTGETGSVKCVSCSAGSYSDRSGQAQCNSCPRGEYQPNLGSTECLQCPTGLTTGMASAISAQECQCPAGTYAKCLSGDGRLPTTQDDLVAACGIDSLSMNSTLTCEPCPDGMECKGFSIAVGPNNADVSGISSDNKQCGTSGSGKDIDGNDIPTGFKCVHTPPLPQKGFYASQDSIYMNYDCFYPARCLGNAYDACAENWSGFVCADCDVGYRIIASSDGEPKAVCETCEGYWFGSVITPFVLIVGGSAMYIVYYLSAKSRQVLGRMAVAATAGLMLQMLQFLSLFGRFSLNFDSPLDTLFDGLDFLSFDLQVLGSSCMLGNNPVFSAFFRLILPLYLVFMLFATAKGFEHASFLGKFSIPYSYDAFANGLGVIWMVFFVSMLLMLTTLIQCYDHPSGGKSLNRFPEIMCGEPEHVPFILMFIFGLIVYVILPLYIVCTQVKNIQSDPIENLNPIRHFFLISRFGVEHAHFTIFAIVRNTLLGLVPIAVPNNGPLHIICFSLIALIAAGIILTVQPWKAWGLNLLDGAVLLVLALAGSWGFAFIPQDDASDPSQVAVASSLSIIILIFLFLIFTWCSFVAGEFFDKRHEKLVKWGFQAPKATKAENKEEKERAELLLKTEHDAVVSKKLGPGGTGRRSVKYTAGPDTTNMSAKELEELHEKTRKQEVMAILMKEEEGQIKNIHELENKIKNREHKLMASQKIHDMGQYSMAIGLQSQSGYAKERTQFKRRLSGMALSSQGGGPGGPGTMDEATLNDGTTIGPKHLELKPLSGGPSGAVTRISHGSGSEDGENLNDREAASSVVIDKDSKVQEDTEV